MTVTIISPKGEGVKVGRGTVVLNQNGQEVEGVTSISIDIKPDSVITATIDVAIESIDGMDNIKAMLGVDTLEEIARLHGFGLVELDEN